MKQTFFTLTWRLILLSSMPLAAFLALNSCQREAAQAATDYPVIPLDFTRVHLEEGFWESWVDLVRETTIPYAFQKCEETGRIDNFIFAGGLAEGNFRGAFGFDDSDVYKIIEGASYSLMLYPDPELESYLDTLIYYMAAAQEDDGYLYTAWTLRANEYNHFACCTYHEEGQWKGTSGASHEFYNAGHMYEAAVAHHLATGKRDFLEVALKNADLVYQVCLEEGKEYTPGHQEIEIGLVKLFRASGDERYLELAKHLLDLRGKEPGSEYAQSHLPVVAQDEAVGHAVRANYMYSAMADVAALTGDSAYLDAVRSLWNNVVTKKLSITGGVGARHQGEAYGANFELPNDPYNETCAAIANVYWNHRMFLLTGEAAFVDVMERSLYNGVLAGLALDGRHFFYPNTLEFDGVATFNRGNSGRSPWFDCSCCPSNLSRFLPSVGGYAYASRGEALYVNLFMNSRATFPVNGRKLEIRQSGNYPWQGRICVEVMSDTPVEAALHIRIPGWARNEVVPSDLFRYMEDKPSGTTFSLQGEEVEVRLERGYAILERTWEKGDSLAIKLPMETRMIQAHTGVKEKEGRAAVSHGPLVYCAEQCDHQQDVFKLVLDDHAAFTVHHDPELLNGVNTLHWDGLKLVPYYAWANREEGKMRLWFPHEQGP